MSTASHPNNLRDPRSVKAHPDLTGEELSDELTREMEFLQAQLEETERKTSRPLPAWDELKAMFRAMIGSVHSPDVSSRAESRL